MAESSGVCCLVSGPCTQTCGVGQSAVHQCSTVDRAGQSRHPRPQGRGALLNASGVILEQLVLLQSFSYVDAWMLPALHGQLLLEWILRTLNTLPYSRSARSYSTASFLSRILLIVCCSRKIIQQFSSFFLYSFFPLLLLTNLSESEGFIKDSIASLLFSILEKLWTILYAKHLVNYIHSLGLFSAIWPNVIFCTI